MDALAVARSLADAATQAWDRVKGDPTRHDKVGQGAGGNATSRADAALETAILTAARRLKLDVLSEEAGRVPGGGAMLAVVDPLDGSRNAGRGIPLHCTSIAVGPAGATRLSELTAGVVRNLVTGDTYAVAHGAATVNGARIRPREFDPREVLVGIIADYAEREVEEAHAHADHHLRDLGSAAVEMCLVATGALDAFHVRRPWLRVVDIAAATLIVRAAGGSVVDPATDKELDMPLDLVSRSGVLAASGPQSLAAVRSPAAAPGKASPLRGQLTWGLVGKAGLSHVRKEADWVREHLTRKGQRVLVESDLAKRARVTGHSLRDLDKRVDLFVTVGGDGTILMVQEATEKPVFGINAGAIGFLAEAEPPQAAHALDQIIAGRARIEERDRLSCRVGRTRLPDATNEVTIQTSRIAKLIQFSIRVDGEHLDTLRGDGLIVSTATGSTGYAMSVGGPLVHPAVNGLVLAPIAPFRLAARPWVVPSNARVEVEVIGRDSATTDKEARVVVDGRTGVEVGAGTVIRIQQSERKARFVRLGGGTYERVRTKLTR